MCNYIKHKPSLQNITKVHPYTNFEIYSSVGRNRFNDSLALLVYPRTTPQYPKK